MANQIGMESWFKWLWMRHGCSKPDRRVWVFRKLLMYWDFSCAVIFGVCKKNSRDSENNQQMLVDSRETGTSKSSKDHLNSVCWPLRGSRRWLGGLGFTSVSSEQETDNYCPDWWFMSSAETGGVANWHKLQHAMHQSICESVVQDAADGAMMWGRFCLFSHNILSSVDDHVPLWSQWTHLSDCYFLNVNA